MTVSTTIQGLLDRVKRDATLGVYGPIYTLRSSVADSDPTIEVNEVAEHITVGSTLSINTELMRVTAIVAETGVVTVARAQGGTSAAAHAEGDVVEQDPRLPLVSLWDWASHEIRSWRRKLYRVQSIDLAVSRNERTYPLPIGTDVDFLLDVRQQPQGTTAVNDDWGTSWTGDAWPHVDAQLIRELPFADFPDRLGLQLVRYPRFSTNLRVTYATPFELASFELGDDLVDDVGLDAGHIDVLEQGVRWRALQAGLVPRTDWRATGVLIEPEQVSLLDIVRAVDMARSLRDRRFNEEALALRGRFPYRKGAA